MRLSRSFTVNEFTKSQTATRLGILNKMDAKQLENAKTLSRKVLQPIRDHFGRISVNSGFRSIELNGKIGGSSNSQHCKGQAADIESFEHADNMAIALWIVHNLEFDQCILEFYEDGIPESGWVHVSYVDKKSNRNNFLRAKRNRSGKVVYTHINEMGDEYI